jgi:hypothetical protein
VAVKNLSHLHLNCHAIGPGCSSANEGT